MQTFYDIFETTAYLSAAGLAALMLIAVPAPPTRQRLLSFVSPLVWIFLSAATVFSTAYLWELIDVSTSSHPFERTAFWAARAGLSSAWTYWLNMALELAAQLLWFTRFRSHPHAILLIACAFLMSPGSERLIYVLH
ncbi:MAG TPA: hypothetical protein VGP12_00360 [Nitrosospira sp.]|jgi:hypothetical protein|nr:hypothetical protein [Nitrosospira sp.]